MPLFDPATMAQTEAVIKVAAREPVTIHRIKYDSFRLETDLWGKVLSFWVDEHGNTLKEEGFMGLVTLKSSAANAPKGLSGEEGTDLYDIASVEVDRRIPDPSRLRFLRLEISGLGPGVLKQEFLNSGRQRFKGGVLDVNVENLPVKTAYSLTGGTARPPHADVLKPFLSPELNIESDDGALISKAREIAGDDHNPLSITRKVTKWVHDNLEKRPVVTVPSALEVLKAGVGDCNEHSVLIAALLRAAGIPAKLSIGLVYTRERFYYHAWNEAWMGEWVSMDAVMNQLPADATHIKLLEGNLEKQVELTGLVGSIKLKVLDYK
jgi:hypothetical protein